MHNKLFFGGKTITLRKMRRFHRWHLIIFSFFFGLVMCYEPQTWGPCLVKKCMLYTLCTLILSNPLHLTIGSNLTEWFKMSFEFQNFVMHIFKFFFLIFRILKRCYQDFNLTRTYHACHTFFGWKVVKNGSPIVWFHPIFINFAKKQYECHEHI